MTIHKTIPFVIIKNIIDDVKTSFMEFVHNPNPDDSIAMFWYITITCLISFGATLCEVFYGFPIHFGENSNKLFFHDGVNSVLLWMLSFCICTLICMIGWLILGFIHWLISSYIDRYYNKYGSPSEEINNYDAE